MSKLTLYLPKARLVLRFLRKRVVALFEHKNVKKVLGSNLAFMLIASSIIPATPVQAIAQEPKEEVIVSVSETLKDSLKTNVKIHYPLEKVIVNQGYSFFHPGVDFEAQKGDEVLPVKAGKVDSASWDITGYGNRVIVTHEDGLETLYAHLAKIEVKTGDTVEPFTKLGEAGSTGRSTGTHLHIEVRRNGILVNPFSILPRIN